ncbi:hypothetical protein Ae201684_009480 [Aphanomyces euteiches]|uniref:Uncharacterized protein n=1 Tax=Aphanomyces euteiches TaxID=100861 RepID=A0A6G0X231_9STRA|nr:hypothetical protein Ae201684_009480 [Aphanomyces euteiches]
MQSLFFDMAPTLLRLALFTALLASEFSAQLDLSPTTTVATTTLAPTTTATPVLSPTTTTAPVTTTLTPVVTTTTATPSVTTTTSAPTTTSALATVTPTTSLRPSTTSSTSAPTTTLETTTPSPSVADSTASTGKRNVFKGFAGLDDWVWWVIIGGGAFVILVVAVCIVICIKRAKAKAREEALQAMEEQRDADNHARMLADAQKQRRDREAQQLQQLQRGSLGSSTGDSSPPKRPSYYRRPSQGRASYLTSASGRPVLNTSAIDGETPYVSVQSPVGSAAPPSSVADRIEALKTRNSLGDSSYQQARDTTLTGYSMDIDGDYESTIGGSTFISPRTKASMYMEVDAAKRNTVLRQSDASDFELDVDGVPRERVSSHRSIEF